jgi:hypothetical protein
MVVSDREVGYVLGLLEGFLIHLFGPDVDGNPLRFDLAHPTSVDTEKLKEGSREINLTLDRFFIIYYFITQNGEFGNTGLRGEWWLSTL